MTAVYLESSAALRDLLDGEQADAIREVVSRAEIVLASQLTITEIARVFARLRVLEPVTAARAATREAQFQAETELWAVHPVDDSIWARCGRPFPVEPVRLLDAIHLATIERLSATLPELIVLSTDDRVRRNAIALGFGVQPA